MKFVTGKVGNQRIMEDAKGKYTQLLSSSWNQETRQEERPARMAGLFSLDLAYSARTLTTVIGSEASGRGERDV